jgi:hypothetical protein
MAPLFDEFDKKLNCRILWEKKPFKDLRFKDLIMDMSINVLNLITFIKRKVKRK